MAALTITAANVIPVADSHSFADRLAGATITQGQVVYLDAATNTVKLADADLSAAAADAIGIALNSALASQPIRIATGGNVGFGAIFTAGLSYYVSPTAGGICVIADITGGVRAIRLGYATTTGNLLIKIENTGVTI